MTTKSNPAPITLQLPEERIIDTVVYTGQLSSDLKAVDSLLDTLRDITARQSTGKTLSSSDIAELHTLQQKLEYYLVHDEKLRAFDYDSLHLHIQNHIMYGTSMTKLKLVVFGIVMAALLVGMGTLALPLDLPQEVKGYLLQSAAYTTIFLGTAGLFLAAAKNLTAEARSAYRLICISTVIIGMTALLQPIATILELMDRPVMHTMVSAPFIVAYVALYAGVRTLGKLAGVSQRLTSIRFLLMILAAAIIVSAALPFLIPPYTDSTLLTIPPVYAVSNVVLNGICVAILSVVVATLSRARRNLTYLYTKSFSALLWAVVSLLALNAYLIGYWLIIRSSSPNMWLNVTAIGIILNAVLFTRAAYKFHKIHRS